jgi:hypothetical protein
MWADKDRIAATFNLFLDDLGADPCPAVHTRTICAQNGFEKSSPAAMWVPR